MGDLGADRDADGKDIQAVGNNEAAFITGPVLEKKMEGITEGDEYPHFAEGGEDPLLPGKGKGAPDLGCLLAENRGVRADPSFALEGKGSLVKGAGEDEEFVEAADIRFA
jgi:hypothetical protein